MNAKKTRRTLLAISIGMMAITAATAATAGVAWFTTTRTATVSFPTASVTSNRGELRVAKLGGNLTGRAYTVGDGGEGYDATMDSISSADGVSFYNALLDVDGSELSDHSFYKLKDPDYAQFGFSAGQQSGANTTLEIYVEAMSFLVTDKGSASLVGDGTTTDIALSETPLMDTLVVKINGTATTAYSYNSGANKIVMNAAPSKDDPDTDENEQQNVTVEYRYEVAANNEVRNSIRVAFFSTDEEVAEITDEHTIKDAMNEIAVLKNETLVWDATHSPSTEGHHGIGVTAAKTSDAGLHANEKHTIRKAAERFIDLEYAVDSLADISAISLKHGEADIDLSTKITVSGRRVTITDDTVAIDRGDVITVTYRADVIGEIDLTTGAEGIDGYYAGNELLDPDGSIDGDLTPYGAYLGQTVANKNLNIVARVWIEGTDENHEVMGLEYDPDTEDSVNIKGHDYKVTMDLSLAAIDANLA
ncbi:MAG: hypothetical protein J5736_03655 [Bacilli bacterium]|nr:hypothetical protein [Bacilli bacterium]